MAYTPVEDLLSKSDFSIYRLIRMASLRACEISATGARLIPFVENQKVATTALEEIRAGKVAEKSVAANAVSTAKGKKK